MGGIEAGMGMGERAGGRREERQTGGRGARRRRLEQEVREKVPSRSQAKSLCSERSRPGTATRPGTECEG